MSFMDKVKSVGNTAAGKVKAAAQVTAKVAERRKLNKATLPKAYLSLGKHIYQEGRFREEFAKRFDTLDEGLAKIAKIREAESQVADDATLGDKAKATAKKAADATSVMAVESDLEKEYRQLGQMAYETHGAEGGPENLVLPIHEALSRLEAVEAEIEEIEAAHAGSFFTPKRVAIGGVITIVLLLGLIGSMMEDEKKKSNDKSPASSSSSTTPSSTNTEDYERRKKLEAELKGKGYVEITGIYGQPIEIYRFPLKPNERLQVWKIDEDFVVAQVIIEAIDGSARELWLPATVLPPFRLERLKRGLNKLHAESNR